MLVTESDLGLNSYQFSENMEGLTPERLKLFILAESNSQTESSINLIEQPNNGKLFIKNTEKSCNLNQYRKQDGYSDRITIFASRSLGGGSVDFKKIGMWENSAGLTLQEQPIESIVYNLYGRDFVFTAVHVCNRIVTF